jgi:hypothetical protein
MVRVDDAGGALVFAVLLLAAPASCWTSRSTRSSNGRKEACKAAALASLFAVNCL